MKLLFTNKRFGVLEHPEMAVLDEHFVENVLKNIGACGIKASSDFHADKMRLI